ncbi:PREDICTED: insulin-like growth factor-binding protein complex acid labile subunit [Nicrophorus vespilloides]|uniref:Insulin-like growth factor-binding protein complex acid labile subunit n=1 Tax=Nicrophorus vespilloides TaxID=110193 RepID=A0ABM1N4H9_NICVS|nr:PREDICTED: insulin-like growth factor-binding protein complex acid labile subunit [Nicrophorus vespilloides]
MSAKGIVFVVLTLCASSVFSRMTYDCGEKLLGCFCGNIYLDGSETKYVVNCTNQGFTNVDMLTDIPIETEMLVFVGNNIPTLPWNIFGDMNKSVNLKEIDMSNNNIMEIKGKAYHHVSTVETLILNHNNLTISNKGDENYHHPRMFSNFVNLKALHLTNAFADNTGDDLADDLHDIFMNSGLDKLYKLHLEQNEIKSFRDQNVFCDLPNIRDIYLADNYIPGLNFNISCLKKLRFLDLEHNNITKLSQRELESLDWMAPPHVEGTLTIDIRRNPLKCDPATKTLYGWMQRTNVTIRGKESIQCHSAKFGTNHLINLKTLAEGKHATVSKGVTVLLVILVLVLISLISAYVYLSKDKLKNKLGPILDKVTRKVQYTTIESQAV